MKYKVISGQYQTTIETFTPKQAAQEALSLWKLKAKKPTLSKITVVVKPDNKEIYLATNDVLSE